MLRIRKEQVKTFEEAAQTDLSRRILAFLRSELPEETADFDDGTLTEHIAESKRRAAIYGIERDAGIAQFVCLTFIAGLTFDEIPEVRSYLQEPGMSPEEKLSDLVDYLTALENDESLG